jgi:RNase_H superfamily
MTLRTASRGDQLARRLDRYRASTRNAAHGPDLDERHPLPHARVDGGLLAERLAAAIDGEVVRTRLGTVVRCEVPSRSIPLDRDRLASLPGQPPPGAPLVCLDTETTGLATAAGTVAFLIGLGWWVGDDFRQVQLLLPDHGDEPALLDAVADHLPRDGWLVTYNGRGFDWPLLVARYRMAGRAAPVHAGHLDLLPIVRRVFRHRLDDARLRSVETGLLGLHRHGDVEGWEIPGRYLGFLRGGPAEPLAPVVRHNDQDVRSLARLLSVIETRYASEDVRRTAPAGDLAGLARAFARAGRLEESLGCLDAALATGMRAAAPAPAAPAPSAQAMPVRPRTLVREEPWWSPRVPADFGGARSATPPDGRPDARAAFAVPWSDERIAAERAHLLRRLGRWDEAAVAWSAIAAGSGRMAVVAAIELAKLREHRLRDVRGALAAAAAGLAATDRRARLGRPEPRLEADLRFRARRLRRRAAAMVG